MRFDCIDNCLFVLVLFSECKHSCYLKITVEWFRCLREIVSKMNILIS